MGGAGVSLRGGRPDSNRRPPGPQPGALPAELRPPRSSQSSGPIRRGGGSGGPAGADQLGEGPEARGRAGDQFGLGSFGLGRQDRGARRGPGPRRPRRPSRAPRASSRPARRRPRRGRGRPRRCRRGMPGPRSAPRGEQARLRRAGRRLRRASAGRSSPGRARRGPGRRGRGPRPARTRSPAPRRARTSAPSARAISCAPRQTPSTGMSGRDRLRQPLALGGKPRMGVGVVDVHRPAHEDRAGDLAVARAARRRASGLTRCDLEAAANASRIRCGPSHGTCWTTSRIGRSSAHRAAG